MSLNNGIGWEEETVRLSLSPNDYYKGLVVDLKPIAATAV